MSSFEAKGRVFDNRAFSGFNAENMALYFVANLLNVLAVLLKLIVAG